MFDCIRRFFDQSKSSSGDIEVLDWLTPLRCRPGVRALDADPKFWDGSKKRVGNHSSLTLTACQGAIDIMRRIITIRQPARLLSDCSCSSRPSVTSSQATRCLVQQHRDLSSSSSSINRPRVSEQRPAVYNNVQSRTFVKKKPKKVWEPRNGLVDEYIPELDPDLDLPELGMEVDIKAPGRLRLAPTPDKIDDSTYIPAVSGEDLEEVGGVTDWWENDKHWSPSMSYVGFGRREKVTDAAVLEAMARRALIETLAVREVEGDRALAGTWMTGGRQTMLKALEVDVVVGEDGAVSLKGDVRAVVEGLKPAAQAEPEQQEAVASDQEAYTDVLPSEEAHQLRKSWDKSWKSVSIEEPRFKFAVCLISYFPSPIHLQLY